MEEALYPLCYTAIMFIQIAAMFFLLLGVVFLIASVFLNMKLLRAAGLVSTGMAILMVLLSLATPYIEGYLYEGRLAYWDACKYPPSDIEPYCGHDYCESPNTSEPHKTNCTCFLY